MQSDKTHTRTNNLNRPLCIKENESIMNDLLKHKSLGPHGSSGEFYQTLKEEIIPILYNLQQIMTEGILSNLWDRHSPIPKPDKDITGEKMHTTISHEHRCKPYSSQ